MTKAEYIALADNVRKVEEYWKRYVDDPVRGATVQRMLDDYRSNLAEFCAAMNPAFHRQRWLDYVRGLCGPNGGKL